MVKDGSTGTGNGACFLGTPPLQNKRLVNFLWACWKVISLCWQMEIDGIVMKGIGKK